MSPHLQSEPAPSGVGFDLGSAEFAENVHRYFWAADLSRADIERLHRRIQDLADAVDLREQQDRLLLGGTCERVFGLLWWEERQNQREPLQSPFTARDRVNLMLSIDPDVGERPSPRLYCPSWAVGEWHTEGVESPHTWLLRADETVIAPAESIRDGASWCIHLAPTPELWILRHMTAQPERYDVVARHGEAIELRHHASSRTIRWQRRIIH